MLETTVQPGTNIVTLDYRDSLTVEDGQRMRQVLDEVIREHDSVRMLAIIGPIDYTASEPKALWLELKAAGYLQHLDRLALVSESAWVSRLTEWTAELAHVSVRTFTSDQRTAALAWITQP